MACWSTKVATSLKRVKIEEKLLWRAYTMSSTLFRFFCVAAIFLLPVSPLRSPRRPLLPFFTRTTQQSVLDGTNGLSSFKVQTMCILSDCAWRGHLCDSTAFLLHLLTSTPDISLDISAVAVNFHSMKTVQSCFTGASKGTAGDAKCVTEILGDKNKEVRRGQSLHFCFKGK